jgi:hypothetical protein
VKSSQKKSIVLGTMALFLAGCASTTVIHSTPEGAKVYLHNVHNNNTDVYVGTTPYTHKDRNFSCTHLSLRLEMDGYQPCEPYICRDEKPDWGAITGGIFLEIPFLWTMGYYPEHTYRLVPLK